MGKILPFRERAQPHQGITTPLGQVQRQLEEAHQQAQQATACVRGEEVTPVRCAAAVNALGRLQRLVHDLSQQVGEHEPRRSPQRYPLLIQAHHVLSLVEQTSEAIQEASRQRRTSGQSLAAWRRAHRLAETYPEQVSELLEELAAYRQSEEGGTI